MEKEHLYMKEEIKEKEKYLASSIIGILRLALAG
jgi:hypothetical protein